MKLLLQMKALDKVQNMFGYPTPSNLDHKYSIYIIEVQYQKRKITLASEKTSFLTKRR
jgi:hypothetical protein